MRPKKNRCIDFQPHVNYFKPQGIPMRLLEEEVLEHDEVESIRLRYIENLHQVACAKKMKISQSTLQRILESANKKIANAIIKGKAIKITQNNE